MSIPEAKEVAKSPTNSKLDFIRIDSNAANYMLDLLLTTHNQAVLEETHFLKNCFRCDLLTNCLEYRTLMSD